MLRSKKSNYLKFVVNKITHFPLDSMQEAIMLAIQEERNSSSEWILRNLPADYYQETSFAQALIHILDNINHYNVKVTILQKLRKNTNLDTSSISSLIEKGSELENSLLTNLFYVLCKQQSLSRNQTSQALTLIKTKKDFLENDKLFTRAFLQDDPDKMNGLYKEIKQVF